MSTVLAKLGQWLWTKLVSPMRNALQSLKKWFSDRLGLAKATDGAAGTARTPSTEGIADLLRSAPAPAASPCPAPTTKPTPGRSSMPRVASGPITPAAPVDARDFATQWRRIGAELSAGLDFLRDGVALDTHAVSSANGLQRLLPMMECAESQIHSLAAESTRGAPSRESLRQVLLQSVLPVLDNLYRGQQWLASDKNRTPMLGRLHTLCTHVRGRFQTLLSAWDVRETVPLNHPFDPSEQEAVVRVNDPAAVRGQVHTVYLPGFWLGPQLLRPAQVGVVC